MPTVRIAGTKDIPEGQMKGYTVEGKQILVANVAGNYYAIDAVCSHMGGYLPSGKLENNIVICPRHGTRFDVTTGKVYKNVNALYKVVTRREATDLNRYDLTIEGEDIGLKIR
jgi:nitrite reductase/ring-hydroxylating ferredoxin subunit